jgi:hypothetical protein
MRVIAGWIHIGWSAAILCGTSCGTGWGAVVDRIAVVVGDTVITESEVIEEARMTEFLNARSLDLSPELRRAAAERLADQQLIRKEMRMGGYPEPRPESVNAALEQLKAERFHGSEAALRTALQKYGLTEAGLKQHLSWQIAVQRFTDARFPSDVAAPKKARTEQKLEAWLREKRATVKIRFFPEAFQ